MHSDSFAEKSGPVESVDLEQPAEEPHKIIHGYR